jgi:hypothetical protein
MNDISLKYFTFGILTGLIISFAAEFITIPLQADPQFVEAFITSCVPYGA